MKHSQLSGNSHRVEKPSSSDGLPDSPATDDGALPTDMPSLSEETERRSPEWQESNEASKTDEQSSPATTLAGESLRETAGSPGTVLNGVALANVRDSSWLELEVCREYNRGSCTRADCRFIHPGGSVIVKDGKVTCCFDYLKDRCNRDHCKYLHPPNKIRDKLIQAGKQYGHAMALATQPQQKTALTAIPPLPVGSALGMPLPMGAMGFPAASSNFAVSMPTSPVGGEIINRLNICRDFERGRCMRGENCFFAHPEPYVRRNPDQTVTICYNFMQGFCRHEQCWYFHPPLHIAALYSAYPPTSPLLPQMLLPSPLLGLPPYALSTPVSPPVSMPPTPFPLPHGIGQLLSPVIPVSTVPPLVHHGNPAPINLMPMSEV